MNCDRPVPSLHLAYLASEFARPSDTFIRNEVNALRASGVNVTTFSPRRPNVENADADVQSHQHETEYLLEAGALGLTAAAIESLVTRPVRTARTLALAWKTRPRGVRGTLKQAAYFAEAIFLAKRLKAVGVKHLHNHIGENSATIAMLASALSGIPYSLTIHGPRVFYAADYWALGAKLDNAAFTVAISDFCRSQCLTFARPDTWPRIHVIRCSVQPLYLEGNCAEQGPALPSARFVCVGRLCVEKGQRLLLSAIKQLIQEGEHFEVVLVGDGPDRTELEQSAAEAGLSGVVRFAGWQSAEQTREWLHSARALVLPSFAEGLPIVIMEAMALGRPIIATQIAAIPELVRDGAHGWIIRPGSTDSLRDAMRAAMHASPDDLHAMGERARQSALDEHDPELQTTKLLRLFISSRGAALSQAASADRATGAAASDQSGITGRPNCASV